MANKVIEMHIVGSIIQQSALNYSERQIARKLNISRNTVLHYIQRFKATTYTWAQL
jgi:transposase